MKARLIFLLVYVPIHTGLSLMGLHQAYNPPSGGLSTFAKCWIVTVTSPILLPLVRYDPDGEKLPEWLQYVSGPLNSLVWGIALLLVYELVRRWIVKPVRSGAHP